MPTADRPLVIFSTPPAPPTPAPPTPFVTPSSVTRPAQRTELLALVGRLRIDPTRHALATVSSPSYASSLLTTNAGRCCQPPVAEPPAQAAFSADSAGPYTYRSPRPAA